MVNMASSGEGEGASGGCGLSSLVGLAVIAFAIFRFAGGDCGGGQQNIASVPASPPMPTISTTTQAPPALKLDAGVMNESQLTELDQAITAYQRAIRQKQRELEKCGAAATAIEAGTCVMTAAGYADELSASGSELTSSMTDVGSAIPPSSCQDKVARVLTAPTDVQLALIDVVDRSDTVESSDSSGYGIDPAPQSAISSAIAPYSSAVKEFTRIATSAERDCSGGTVIHPGGRS
jgi:hypothetical protein